MSYNLSIDRNVKKIEFRFRCTGVNIKVGVKTRYDKYLSLFIFFLNFPGMILHNIIATFVWFFHGVSQHQSFTELTYLAPCIFISSLASIKTLTMLLNETTAEILIERIRKMELEQQKRPLNAEIKEIMKKEENFLNKLMKVLSIFYTVAIISFITSPILLVLLSYKQTKELVLVLPLSASYPFDPFNIRFYPWVYLYQCWTVVLVVFYISSVDFMFYVFCTHLRAQFRLLAYYTERVISSDYNRGTIHHLEETKFKLTELIKWHQDLLCSAELLESMYTRSTLYNFFTSSMLICLAGFNVVEIDAFVLSFLTFLLMSLLQIFFLCYFGDLLKESSMAVGEAVYNSKWYITDLSIAKMLLLMFTRSQTPCKLTAWNYAEVNLRSFMKICSTAWSYFALLQTLYTTPSQEG